MSLFQVTIGESSFCRMATFSVITGQVSHHRCISKVM